MEISALISLLLQDIARVSPPPKLIVVFFTRPNDSCLGPRHLFVDLRLNAISFSKLELIRLLFPQDGVKESKLLAFLLINKTLLFLVQFLSVDKDMLFSFLFKFLGEIVVLIQPHLIILRNVIIIDIVASLKTQIVFVKAPRLSLGLFRDPYFSLWGLVEQLIQ